MPILDSDVINTYEVELPVCDGGYGEAMLAGDFHLRNPKFSPSYLQRYIKIVKDNPHMQLFLMGDYFEAKDFVADGRMVMDQRGHFGNQVRDFVGFFTPVKEQVACALWGNHDERVLRLRVIKRVLDALGVSNYLKYIIHKNLNENTIVGQPEEGLNLIIKVGKQRYTLYMIHGNTSARYRTMIQIERMLEVFDTDVVAHGHNHVLDTSFYRNFVTDYVDGVPSRQVRERIGVLTGCFLQWGKYAEARTYRMAPILRFYSDINFIEPIIPQQRIELHKYFTHSAGLLPLQTPKDVYPQLPDNLNQYGVNDKCLL